MKNKLKVAICYDFDGTLAPGNMQEHHFIPDLGIEPDEFWREVKTRQKNDQCDQILAYMHLMIDKAATRNIQVTKEMFVSYGSRLQLFPGTVDWFRTMKRRASIFYDIELEHYILSAGLKPMIEGVPFCKDVKRIYASEFIYNSQNQPIWPSYSVNFTSKTQFLFRIEKGIFQEEDIDALNDAKNKSKIYIPFNRMIYIGDGLTDVPCMKLVKDRGGYSIAVYDVNSPDGKSLSAATKLFKDKRVHFIAPTEYTKNSELWEYIDYILNKISLENLMISKQRICLIKKKGKKDEQE